MLLTQLNPGQRAKILNIQFLEQETRRRLFALGILPKSTIEFIRKGPMNGPLQCRCQGQMFAFSKHLAQAIEVEVI